MPRYYVKMSGAIWDMPATDKSDIERLVKQQTLWPYLQFTYLEIGKDCDENGWPLPKDKEK